MKLIFILAGALLAMVSCGGDSGSDSEKSTDISGRYLLSQQSLVDDSCGLGLPDSLSNTTTVRVNQLAESVALNIQSDLGFLPLITSSGLVGVRYEQIENEYTFDEEFLGAVNFSGLVNEDRSGFLVRTQEFQDNQCTSNYSLDFKPSAQSDVDFETLYSFSVNCPNRSCTGAYQGTASRRPATKSDRRYRTRNLKLINDSCSLGLNPEIGYISSPRFYQQGDQIDLEVNSFLPNITNRLVLLGEAPILGTFTAQNFNIFYTGSFNGNSFEATNKFTMANQFTDIKCVTNSNFLYNDGRMEFKFLINCPNRVCEGSYSGTAELSGGSSACSGRECD
jgi:hypothetical protein